MTNKESLRKKWNKTPESKYYSPRGNKIIVDFFWNEIQKREEELIERINNIRKEAIIEMDKSFKSYNSIY